MKISKEDINITSYLVGIHAFRKDHNYGNYKTDLINDLQFLFDANFESIKAGGIDILKVTLNDELELRMTPKMIIYQDKPNYERVVNKSREILKLWSKYSPNLKMSLIGLVTEFEIRLSEYDDIKNYKLFNSYFKNFKIGTKLRGIELVLDYDISLKTYTYNIRLTMSEKHHKENSFIGSVDFHSTTENTISGLDPSCLDRTCSGAKEYFEKDFYDFLNYKELNND